MQLLENTTLNTEKESFKLIQQGNKLAFDQLFRKYYAYLCNYAFKFLKEKEASEEVVQEVFFKVWENRKKLNIEQSVKSYLFRMVQNHCLNLIKHLNVREGYKEYNQEMISWQENVESVSAEVNELDEKIKEAIEDLPPERKKIFMLSRFEGLKYKEIASQLNISIKTVENQMGKALQHMRVNLAEFLAVSLLITFYLS